MSISQAEFNQFVRTFNEHYLELLHRAAACYDDERILESFSWLKDSYEVVLRLHDTGEVDYEVSLLPLSLQGNRDLLTVWGFTAEEIDNILKFFVRFRDHYGRDLEEEFASVGIRE